MTMKKGLFSLFRRFFVSEASPEKKEKRRKWGLWRLGIKKRLPSITARAENEAEEEQNLQVVTDVTENVQENNNSQLDRREYTEDDPADKAIVDPEFDDKIFRKNQIEELAVVKIQTAFRGYLARKALRALKGIVKLQAYIRGRAVRRQAMTTLKCLQSVVNIQSKVCAGRTRITEGSYEHSDENKELQTLRDKIIKVDTNSQRRWDDSLLTKEEAKAMIMSKTEAAIRRERIREYAVTHRKSAESYQRRPNTRWKYWLDQWVDTQLSKSKELEDLNFSSNPKAKEDVFRDEQLKTPRNASPRRTIHPKRHFPVGEEDQNPAFRSPQPTYMAATESAKAKARSLSSPRVRPGNFDTQSESYSPFKNKICLTTSIMSEAPSRVRVNHKNTKRASSFQQRSPSLRG